MKKLLMAGAAVALLFGATATAQPYGPPDNGNQNQDNGYNNPDNNNRDGYYDQARTLAQLSRQQRLSRQRDGDDEDADNDNAGPPPPPPPGYYQQGAYEDNCRRGNTAAGTIFGALAGGLIGGAASHGNGGAVVGGAILGGLLGNAVTHDMPCEDHPYAFRVYSDGLNGELGRHYEWRHGDDYGYFTPEREFHRDGMSAAAGPRPPMRAAAAIPARARPAAQRDGNWRFD